MPDEPIPEQCVGAANGDQGKLRRLALFRKSFSIYW
ncbi:unnamed protein product, partial [marine sediment metagenome]